MQKWDGFLCLLKSCFHFPSSSELTTSPSKTSLFLFQITFCIVCFFSSCLNFMSLLDWLREGQKVVRHMPSTHCAFFLLYLHWFIYYEETQVTLCRTRWPFPLLNQRESLGGIAKGFLESLLQIYILVLSSRLKITGLFYSSHFCPYFSTHLTGMNV